MNRTLVWAHRGASAYAPENTLAAFEMAVDMKADGIELDVQRTKDGKLVVIHDETLKRVSGQAGWVKDYAYKDLQNINVNLHFPDFGKQAVPTLEEVYALLKNTDLTVNVELKTGVCFYPGIEQQVIELTEREGMQERVLYSSFNHHSLRIIRQLRPHVQTGVLYSDGWIGVADYAKKIVQATAVHPSYSNVQYPAFFEFCKAQGLKVHVWTVNKKAQIQFLCENRVDAVITNDPKLARIAITEKCRNMAVIGKGL